MLKKELSETVILTESLADGLKNANEGKAVLESELNKV